MPSSDPITPKSGPLSLRQFLFGLWPLKKERFDNDNSSTESLSIFSYKPTAPTAPISPEYLDLDKLHLASTQKLDEKLPLEELAVLGKHENHTEIPKVTEVKVDSNETLDSWLDLGDASTILPVPDVPQVDIVKKVTFTDPVVSVWVEPYEAPYRNSRLLNWSSSSFKRSTDLSTSPEDELIIEPSSPQFAPKTIQDKWSWRKPFGLGRKSTGRRGRRLRTASSDVLEEVPIEEQPPRSLSLDSSQRSQF